MSVRIKYDGVDVFSGIGPVPVVERNFNMIQAGERWGALHSFTMQGVITGGFCSGTFDNVVYNQQLLLSRLSKDFQTLEIEEDSQIVYSQPHTIIREINFDNSKMVGLLPYTIRVECYPSGFFSGHYGVLNPNHNISFDQQSDGRISITHTISAKGFNTTSGYSNALENAKNFVAGLTGYGWSISPQFINVCSGINPCLRTQSESIDRFNATYSITENYIADPSQTGYGLLRYTTSIESGLQDGVSVASIRGSVEGCKGAGISGARSVYSGFDTYSAAVQAYIIALGDSGLHSEYISSGVEENPLASLLNFNVVFNNDITPSVYFDYRTDVNTDFQTEISTINFDGTIRARGDLLTRWTRVSGFYTGLNAINYVYQAISGYNLNYPLNPRPIESGTTFNQFNGEIQVSLSLNNKVIPPSGLDKFDYNIAFTPSLRKIISQPLVNNVNNGYAVTDLGFANRAIMTVNGSAQIVRELDVLSGINIIKNQINYISNLYATGSRKVLESVDITTGNASVARYVGFNASWSYEDTEFSL